MFFIVTVLPMNGQITNSNGRRRRDPDGKFNVKDLNSNLLSMSNVFKNQLYFCYEEVSFFLP